MPLIFHNHIAVTITVKKRNDFYITVLLVYFSFHALFRRNKSKRYVGVSKEYIKSNEITGGRILYFLSFDEIDCFTVPKNEASCFETCGSSLKFGLGNLAPSFSRHSCVSRSRLWFQHCWPKNLVWSWLNSLKKFFARFRCKLRKVWFQLQLQPEGWLFPTRNFSSTSKIKSQRLRGSVIRIWHCICNESRKSLSSFTASNIHLIAQM